MKIESKWRAWRRQVWREAWRVARINDKAYRCPEYARGSMMQRAQTCMLARIWGDDLPKRTYRHQ